jgi:hypothetical protein
MSDDDRRAAAAITTLLNRAALEHADTAVTANAIVQALRGHGWRPTPARRPEPWQPQPGHRSEPTPEWHTARQAIRNPHD